jgi:hypothetical protein
MSDRSGRDESPDGEPLDGAGGNGDRDGPPRARRREPAGPDRGPPADTPGEGDHEDEEEWEISLSDLREQEEADELAQLREADPEPGTVSPESAAFVVLGVVVCVLLLYVGFL